MPQSHTREACDLLDADHVAVKHLFVAYARLAMAGEATAQERQAIAGRICDELTVHARIEEEIFYPALQGVVPAAMLDEAKSEHQEAKDLIARIEQLPAAGPDLDALVERLARAIEHHVKEERDGIFPKARSAPRLDLDALGAKLKERQQELQGQAA